jgi:hypothetical protein
MIIPIKSYLFNTNGKFYLSLKIVKMFAFLFLFSGPKHSKYFRDLGINITFEN